MKSVTARHHGIALLLVLLVTALAALIGFAMLSSAGLQAQVARNSTNATSAEYLAESAIQTAMYYLQNPTKLPAGWGAGTAIDATFATIPGVPGNFDVKVVSAYTCTTHSGYFAVNAGLCPQCHAALVSTSTVYAIIAVGRSGGSTPLVRHASALVKPVRAVPNYAVGVGSAVTIPAGMTITGDLVAASGPYTGVARPFTSSDYVVPAVGAVNYYGTDPAGGTYTMPDDAELRTPQSIAATTWTTTTFTANASNPGRVFRYTGTSEVTINGKVVINGTLIVKGDFIVKKWMTGTNSLTINPAQGFPAMIVDNRIIVKNASITLEANGLVWTGGGIATSGTTTGSKLIINGALLVGSGGTLAAPAGGATVTYVGPNVSVTSLSPSTPQSGGGVKLLRWNQ